MSRIIANLLIVTAVILLGLAYRLKQKAGQAQQRPNVLNCAQARPARKPRRRSGPGRIEQLFLELGIVFNSARFGLIGA